MKLIDLLVQELPKRGGWPEGPSQYLNDFLKRNKLTFFVNHHYSYFEDWDGDQVTREQYEAALAAAQEPVWDGEGLPPAGCECETRFILGGKWFFFRCVAVDFGIAFGWAGKDAVTLDKGSYEFRPIRSEADKRRDEAIAALKKLKPQLVGELAGYLYDEIAAGKIPHIRIEQAA
ncbi:hypothetical protein [Cronobacter malonaticus]|uniref:hypothetical protein n=1 Tax=Cronobacter malonaticus TaxID=413503 RepID=UPI000CFC5886|nr:hypothetical protein [Cronobacter malonaticus]